MRSLIVEEKYHGKKLNSFLFEKFPSLKSSTLYKALRKKDIRVNDKRVSENVTISSGDEIKVYISDEFLFPIFSISFEKIYEDEQILIINKPAGILVNGDNSLTTYLSQQYPFIAPCHRLDRNTMGLVVFAKTKQAEEILLSKFKNHEIKKKYMAYVYGIPSKKQARLEAYLFKDSKKSKVYISDEFKKGYQKIITSYQVLASDEKLNTSLLDVTLETGRTHQIRAHLAHIGLPIIGDGKYGIGEINKRFQKKTQMLCSYSIQFCFSNDAEILNDLNEKKFQISCPFEKEG
jgi:pseudouridine synthase, rluA family